MYQIQKLHTTASVELIRRVRAAAARARRAPHTSGAVRTTSMLSSFLVLIALTGDSPRAGWPARTALRKLCTAPLQSASATEDLHVVARIVRRRMLGKKFAFIDLQELDTAELAQEASLPAELQVMLRTGADGLQQPLHRHLLVPGALLAVRGRLRHEEGACPTLIARAAQLASASPCEHGVSLCIRDAHSGVIDTASAIEALSNSESPRAEALATQLVLSQAAGPSAGEGVVELVRLLQQASQPRVVAIAVSGGGHTPAGLSHCHGIPSLAFLYSSPQAVEHALAAAETAGGGLAATRALETAPPLSAAAVLDIASLADGSQRRTTGDADEDTNRGWVTVEAEVARRQRFVDDLPGAERRLGRVVLLSLRDELFGRHAEQEDASWPDGDGGDESTGNSEPSRRAPAGRLLRCLLHPALSLAPAVHEPPACAEDAEAAAYCLDSERLATFDALAAPGARVRLVGRLASLPPGRTNSGAGRGLAHSSAPEGAATLIVYAVRLERCAAVERVVKQALDAVAERRLTDAEAARSLVPHQPHAAAMADRIQPTQRQMAGLSRAERSWHAAELSAVLQTAFRSPQHGVGVSDAQAAAVALFQPLRERFPLVHEMGVVARPPLVPGTRTERRIANRMVRTSEFQPARPRRRVQTGTEAEPGAWQLRDGRDGSFWTVKKRPQLLWMASVIERLLTSHPAWGRRPLHVVDIGGGKGFLAEHLARSLGASRVQVTLVETIGERVDQARARVERHDAIALSPLPNLRYLVGDAAQLAATGQLDAVDVVCGLHACGGLSDLVIAHAVKLGAAFAVCTCCFCSNRNLCLPYGQSRDDWLNSRCEAGDFGVEARAEDSAHLIDLLLRTAEHTGAPSTSRAAAHTINAMRAAAAEREWERAGQRDAPSDIDGPSLNFDARPARLRVECLEYDVKYSARNLCVVGQPLWEERW